jgi:hypothetical protein
MRLDGVEIKVSLDGDQTEHAVQVLDLAEPARWKIYFVEDVTAGLGEATPLLEHQLILRARQKSKGKDDVTVKFRPGRRSQLTDAWLAAEKDDEQGLDVEFKIEEDWAGERRVLSVSLTAERPDGLVAAAADGRRAVGDLLVQKQRRLIEECAGTPVNLGTLTVLPAVAASRWPTFPVSVAGGPDLDVRAERWTVADLDFLELSVVADLDEAPAAQAALTAFVHDRGLHPSTGAAKTTQVLQRLVKAAASR